MFGWWFNAVQVWAPARFSAASRITQVMATIRNAFMFILKLVFSVDVSGSHP
jgi:hypothetical protein